MKYLFLISALFMMNFAIAQPKIKLYGYSQNFTPGNIPVDMDGEGGGVKKPHTRTHYYIYLSVPAKENIKIKEIRVSQQWFKAQSASPVKSPVYIDQPSKKMLVAATSNKVLELQLGDSSKLVRKMLLTRELYKAELIVSYTWKGRDYMISQKEWKVLPPVLGL